MHTHINTFINARLCLSTDIDECANDSTDGSADGSTEGSQNGCNHICTNTNGSFSCECFSGYQLSDDMMTCVGRYVSKYTYIHTYIYIDIHTYTNIHICM